MEIINDTLLAGMKTVGDLFGSGQMQLPFVLQSAEVMKTAVAHLEPHLDSSLAGAGKGTIVLTGSRAMCDHRQESGRHHLDQQRVLSDQPRIKQPIGSILDAADENRADAIGMSGLLVKSTVIMKENLQEMNSRGVATAGPCCSAGPR